MTIVMVKNKIFPILKLLHKNSCYNPVIAAL